MKHTITLRALRGIMKKVFHGKIYRPSKEIIVLIIIASAYTLIFTSLQYKLYRSLQLMNNGDFATYNNAIWNIINLRSPIWDPSLRIGGNVYHLSVVMFILAPLYALHPHPATLFFLESLAIAVSIFPLYLLSKEILKIKFAGILFSLSYLFYPALQFATLDTFHEISLAIPILFCTLYFFRKSDFRKFITFALLTMLVREDLGLIIMMLGIYGAINKKSKKWIFIPVAFGLFYFVLTNGILIPLIFKGYPYNRDTVARYGYLSQVDPAHIPQLIISPTGYWLDLLQPSLFLPLLSPITFFVSIPILMENLLSASPVLRNITFTHYSSPIIPFIYLSSLLGLKKVLPFVRKFIKVSIFKFTFVQLSPNKIRKTSLFLPVSLVLLSTLATNAYRNPSPVIYVRENFANSMTNDKVSIAIQILHLIPNEASLATDFRLLPTVSQRKNFSTFWYDGSPPIAHVNTSADFILTDPSYPTSKQIAYVDGLRSLMDSGKWEVIFKKGGFILLRNSESKYGAFYINQTKYYLAFKYDAVDFIEPTEWKIHNDHLGIWIFSDPPRESPNATVSHKIYVKEEALYHVFANVYWGDERGTLRFKVDDDQWFDGIQPLSEEKTWKDTLIASLMLTEGFHTLTFMNSKPYEGAGFQDIKYFFLVQSSKPPQPENITVI